MAEMIRLFSHQRFVFPLAVALVVFYVVHKALGG